MSDESQGSANPSNLIARAMTINHLAHAILAAAKLHEGSWYESGDYGGDYEISVSTAVTRTCGEDLGSLIYLLFDRSWNQTIEWANRVTEGKS